MTRQNVRLSGIIIAKNEAERIGGCIDALDFCSEVIVIDNGSNDETKDIARNRNAKVYEYPKPDFSGLRNFARDKANGQWLLYVDADETVTPKLAESIGSATAGNIPSYELRRVNLYLGKRWPGYERMLRLIRKDALIR